MAALAACWRCAIGVDEVGQRGIVLWVPWVPRVRRYTSGHDAAN
jgi:hypothetical protein